MKGNYRILCNYRICIGYSINIYANENGVAQCGVLEYVPADDDNLLVMTEEKRATTMRVCRCSRNLE